MPLHDDINARTRPPVPPRIAQTAGIFVILDSPKSSLYNPRAPLW